MCIRPHISRISVLALLMPGGQYLRCDVFFRLFWRTPESGRAPQQGALTHAGRLGAGGARGYGGAWQHGRQQDLRG